MNIGHKHRLSAFIPALIATAMLCAADRVWADSPDITAVSPDCPLSVADGRVQVRFDRSATVASRECVRVDKPRSGAVAARKIEVMDSAVGPESTSFTSTAGSATYALSLVNIRPDWVGSKLTGETDGLSILTRQGLGDTAALLANVGIRRGFAATIESYTFSVAANGATDRGVRTQIGVVNARDGGEYGAVLLAEHGKDLLTGLRIASAAGSSNWKKFLEFVSPSGEALLTVTGNDGAIIAGDIQPRQKNQFSLGTAQAPYASVSAGRLNLPETPFARLPTCAKGSAAGTIAFVSDAPLPLTTFGQRINAGGGSYRIFVKCDGNGWTGF